VVPRNSVPAWFEDAKLGIFVHWTLASVPAWAPDEGTLPELLRGRYAEALVLSPYAEWYWNALRVPGSPTARHHAAHHADAPYEAFRAPFEATLACWDPGPWAALFAEAGARYVVLVTKHHDGYGLWPTHHDNPLKPGWHSARDVVGELAAAVRARGLRFGVYYSGGLDWTWEPRPIRSLADVPAALPCHPGYAGWVDAQVRELVERVAPSVLWNDIAWPTARAPRRLFEDYYAAVPDGVVNDRFLPVPAVLAQVLRTRPARALLDAVLRRAVRRPGHTFAPPHPPHCDFQTPEYATFREVRHEKWEATRGIGHSFGHNQNEPESNFVACDELVRSFVDVVSKNGNLLLNVGPTSAGEIPEVQASRLRALGAWLRESGEAIYATRPWHSAEGATREGVPLRFTARGDALYAIALGTPEGETLTLRDVAARRATLLGHGPLAAERAGDDLRLAWPRGLPARPAWALRLAS
jgi:alpha-L-fucosidase